MAVGYRIERYKRKDGKITYNVRVRYKQIKPHPTNHFNTRAAAEKWGREIVHAIDHGTYRPDSSNDGLNFADAIDRYVSNLEEGPPRTKKHKSDKRSRGNTIKKYRFAKLPMASISTSHLRDFRDDRLAKGKAASTVRNELNLISLVFRVAISEWDMEHLSNPMDKLMRPPPDKGRERRFKKGEKQAILNYVRQDSRSWVAPVLEFLWTTGMRCSEVANIGPEDVLLDQREIWLGENKTDYPRHIPLPKRAVEILQSFKPNWGTERVFGVKAQTIQSGWLELKNEMLEKGILDADLHLHDFRHEAVSKFFEIKNSLGEPLLKVVHVQLITGHKDLNTLGRYAQIKAETVVATMEVAGI